MIAGGMPPGGAREDLKFAAKKRSDERAADAEDPRIDVPRSNNLGLSGNCITVVDLDEIAYFDLLKANRYDSASE